VTELTREELLVENKRLLGALQRLGEAYQIREQNFADYVLATKDTRASAGRYRLAWLSARRRSAYTYGEMGVVLWINQQLERVP